MRAILLFCALGWAASAGAADWTVLPTGTGADIHDIGIIDNAEGWAVGDSGYVSHSSPDLSDWTNRVNVTSSPLRSTFEPAYGQVWVGGPDGVVYVEIGSAWYERGFAGGGEFSYFSQSSGAAFAVGPGGAIVRTTDGGLDWVQENSSTGQMLRGGSGYPIAGAMVVGDAGTALRTTNGGVSWTSLNVPTSEDLYAVAFDQTHGQAVAIGAHGVIVRSSDNGTTWKVLPSPTQETLRDISQYGNFLVSVGDHGAVIKSSDWGVTWCSLSAGTFNDLFAVDCVSTNQYFVAGSHGLLLRTTDGGGTCGAPASVPAEVPASGSVRIEGAMPLVRTRRVTLTVSVREAQSVRADLFDVRGRNRAHLMNEPLAGGASRSVTLDPGALEPGVYLLRVQGGKFLATKKVVVAGE